VRRLVEQHRSGGRHALEFPAERHEVQIRLKDLALRPVRLERPGEPHLPQLLRERPGTALTVERRIEERGELHRDRAGTAQRAPHQTPYGRSDQGGTVHTTVTIEPPIL